MTVTAPRWPTHLLTETLDIRRPVQVETFSGQTETWEPLRTARARVVPASGASQGALAVYGEQYRGVRRLRAWVDTRTGATVMAGMRVMHDDVLYTVIDAQGIGVQELWLAEVTG